MILEIKDHKVYKDPLVLLDLLDLKGQQELTQQYLDPLENKEQQDHRGLRVIKEIKDHKVYMYTLWSLISFITLRPLWSCCSLFSSGSRYC